jgi:hypothetical protein
MGGGDGKVVVVVDSAGPYKSFLIFRPIELANPKPNLDFMRFVYVP